MRILYITPAKLPSQAANSVHVMKMAQALARGGHDVCLAFQESSCYIEKDIFKLYGVKNIFHLLSFRLGLGRLGRVLFVGCIAFFSSVKKFDLIYSRCVPSAFISCFFRQNVLLELHDSPLSFGHISRWMIFKTLKMKNFLGLVVISHSLKDHVLSISNLKPENIMVFHDGADDFSNELLPALLCPQSHEYLHHVGYTGHLYKGRGIDVLIDIAKLSPNNFFHVVGGTPEDTEYWKSQSSIIQNIHFYGHVPHVEVSRYVMAFDILLAPYQAVVAVHGNKGNTAKWMSPLKIFEYMSAQKPIICSDIPVLLEVLTDHVNALLCPPDDVLAWVDAIERIKSDKAMAKKIAVNARKDFLNHYTWASRAQSVLNYLGGRL